MKFNIFNNNNNDFIKYKINESIDESYQLEEYDGDGDIEDDVAKN